MDLGFELATISGMSIGLSDMIIPLEKPELIAKARKEIDGVELPFGENFFQEFVVRIPGRLDEFIRAAREQGVLAGIDLSEKYPGLGGDAILVAVTERRTRAELEKYCSVVVGKGGK